MDSYGSSGGGGGGGVASSLPGGVGGGGGGGGVGLDDTPRLFINWSVVQGLLQANTDGVIIQHTLLLKLDGSLLTSSHETPETKAAVAAAAAAAAAAASAAASVPSSSSSAVPAASASASGSTSVLPKIVGALVANIWKGCESNGFQCLQSQALQIMMIECMEGIVAVSRLGRFLVAIYASKAVQRGTLRQKMNDILTHLQPLHRVYSN